MSGIKRLALAETQLEGGGMDMLEEEMMEFADDKEEKGEKKSVVKKGRA